jgi:hypothetical protein
MMKRFTIDASRDLAHLPFVKRFTIGANAARDLVATGF